MGEVSSAFELFPLYGGAVTLQYNSKRHLYYEGGKQVDGVTGILGILDKPALIPWAVNCCVDYIGGNPAKGILPKLIPGHALDELAIKNLMAEAKLAHRVIVDHAGDIGTMVHKFAEDWIKGRNPALPVHPQVRNGCMAFIAWVRAHRVRFLHAERKIFSRRWRYAGTLDGEAFVDDKLAIVDFKTGKAIYPEARFQTAAYEAARREEDGLSYTRWVARFDKVTGEFQAIELTDLAEDFGAFMGAFAAHKRLKELKAAARKKAA